MNQAPTEAIETGARHEAGAEGGCVTPERQLEIKSRIDQGFNQFSLDEVQRIVSGDMTFCLAFPGFSMWERGLTEAYFNEKRDELRREMPSEKRSDEADDQVR